MTQDKDFNKARREVVKGLAATGLTAGAAAVLPNIVRSQERPGTIVLDNLLAKEYDERTTAGAAAEVIEKIKYWLNTTDPEGLKLKEKFKIQLSAGLPEATVNVSGYNVRVLIRKPRSGGPEHLFLFIYPDVNNSKRFTLSGNPDLRNGKLLHAYGEDHDVEFVHNGRAVDLHFPGRDGRVSSEAENLANRLYQKLLESLFLDT